MADQETKDAIQETALTVVQEQQSIVGGAMVGAAGTGVLAEGSQSQFDILEQIRDLQLRAVRGISDVATKIGQLVTLDKEAERRAREDATELAKENQGAPGVGGESIDIPPDPEAERQGGMLSGLLGKLGGFLLALPGVAFITRLLAPITAFFGRGGMLFKVFGRFGPIGLIIGGFALLYKYSDEIAKALAPALDKIKELLPKLKPVMDFLIMIGDFLIKNILEGIGGALTYVIEAITRVVDGFIMLFDGDILGGLNEIFGGIFDFVLAIPKAILETVINILTPLATAVGEFFTNLYNDIISYVNDVVTKIGDWFISLKDNIITFFVDAYNAVKQTITDAVQGAFNFISDIFNSIADFMSESYTKAKNFVTGLPDRILSFISNMFSPIIDFFNNIGNRIKMTINGVIDALPLPGFVKDKIRFDVEPTQDELDAETNNAFEKLEAPKVDSGEMSNNDQFFADINKHKDAIQKFMEETGQRLDLQATRFLYNDGMQMYSFKAPDGTNTLLSAKGFDGGAQENIDFIKSGASFKIIGNNTPNVTASDVAPIEAVETKPIVIQKGGDTNTASVQQKTDVYSGTLDTGVDSYHDRAAFNYT